MACFPGNKHRYKSKQSRKSYQYKTQPVQADMITGINGRYPLRLVLKLEASQCAVIGSK